ncbi:sigma-70 family RNA polymerase sigma factor [Belliella sp. R4-6]|uniref:Sigma-70 family RNA polymerase sigma factor n=1 Tax=Belliella alkalica TaxID=1730871 RepID=A0ABS9VHF0_9BACT|nr:sigma-70 family RNA polymerase sigma factor [Belliella alkalica]MCH7415268.1 sigma-70 family RNA polymerase sigma factor [Belliella alkalica]
MTPLDNETFEQFKSGNKQAIEKVYKIYKVPVMRFVQSFIKDREAAENIFHEVFLKIFDKKDALSLEAGFQSYLFTITKNEVFDYFKKLKSDSKKKEAYWLAHYGQEESTFEEGSQEDLYVKLESAVKCLSAKKRKILELSYFENLSYYEISERLDISKNTVKNQLVKARSILKSHVL